MRTWPSCTGSTPGRSPSRRPWAAAGIPYQVRDGAYLSPVGTSGGVCTGCVGRRIRVRRPRRRAGRFQVTDALGYRPGGGRLGGGGDPPADLGRLRALAAEFARANPDGDVDAFLEELGRRFSIDRSGRGVNLMTYHRAKGLEFDAVFLPRLLDGELPFRSGRSRAPDDEERRLLYVGVTRARRHLFVTWPLGSKPRSPFVTELSGIPEITQDPSGNPSRPLRRARCWTPSGPGGANGRGRMESPPTSCSTIPPSRRSRTVVPARSSSSGPSPGWGPPSSTATAPRSCPWWPGSDRPTPRGNELNKERLSKPRVGASIGW